MEVKKYFGRCYPVLPAVYDESLSYYESVCKLVAKVNELVDVINNVNVDILNQANAYTDSQIRNLEGRVTQAVNDVKKLQEDLKNDYDNFATGVNNKLSGFDKRLTDMVAEINEIVYSVNARTDLAIQQNNEYIFKEINDNILGNITVINYFTGERVTVQEMFNYLATLHLDESLTYAVLVVKDITVDNLISKNITYTNLIKNGGTLL